MKKIAMFVIAHILMLGLISASWALTNLISPTGDGGLETGTTFAANGWTIDSSTTLNRYWVGNAPTVYAGSRCSFISNALTPWGNTNGAVVKHMYRDVTFPAGEANITLSFYYKLLTPEATFDGFKIYLCATSFTPVSGTLPTGTQIGSTWYDTPTAWTLATITIPASYAGTSARLVFSWVNDNTNPRGVGALDNISLTSDVANPSTFTATVASSSQINLGWTKNASAQDVMVAYNTTNTFGTPVNGTTYSAGNSISGGGTVIYNGNLTSFNHTPLVAGTTYYYKAWSLNTAPNYSTGMTANAATTSIANPASFTATAASSSMINLNWTRNAASNKVLVAWNTSNTFGTPAGGTAYSVGNTLSGGGTILYNGSDVYYNHTGLNAQTPYYYKVWSLDARPNYSTGSTANATTSNYASTQTVSIGTGTATTATVPITGAVAYSYTEQIYTQAQINTAGSISKLRFYYTSGGTANSTTWTILMGHTTKTSFASTTDWVPDTQMTEVYRGLVTFPAAGNWMEITLQVQFPYNNINNLVIAVDENTAGNAGSACNWGTFTSGTNTAIIYSNASTNPYPAYPPTATSRAATINRIQLDINSYKVDPPAVTRLLVTNSNKQQTVTITNNSNSNLVITNVTDSATWLTYSVSTPITITPGNSSTISLTLNANGMGAGTNTTNLVITANAVPITVPVGLKVITNSVPVNPRHVAQYEDAVGAIIRYPLGIPYTMVVDLADDDLLYCVVSSANQATATTNFTSNGVNMTNVRWIVAASDSYWSRDWGPMTIFEGPTGNRTMKIMDFHYNRNARTNDNALPSVIANYLSVPYYFIPASLTGGNNMTDGMGLEFSDWYAYEQNDGNAATGVEGGFTEIYSYTQTEFDDLYRLFMGSDYAGFNFFDDPTATYIHHMDTYAKLLDVDKVIVAQVISSDTRYAAYEALAAHWASLISELGTPYTIYRVTETGNEAYTNSFHLNDEIFVPFEGVTADDNAALAVYQAALPGHTIRGYTAGTNAWLNTDAIHCRVNTVFSAIEDEELPVELSSFTATISATNYVMLNWITQSETNVAGFRIYRGLNDDMSEAEMLNVFIPGTNTSQMQSYIFQDTEIYEDGTYYYWLENQDFDGSSSAHGPISIHVQLNGGSVIPPIPIVKGINNVYPNPFNPTTTILYGMAARGEVSIDIYNLRGQLVRNLMYETKDPGYNRVLWDGLNNNGQNCSSGVYYIVMRAGTEYYTRKAVLVK